MIRAERDAREPSLIMSILWLVGARSIAGADLFPLPPTSAHFWRLLISREGQLALAGYRRYRNTRVSSHSILRSA